LKNLAGSVINRIRYFQLSAREAAMGDNQPYSAAAGRNHKIQAQETKRLYLSPLKEKTTTQSKVVS